MSCVLSVPPPRDAPGVSGSRGFRKVALLADVPPASAGKFDDVHYPAYSMGAASEMLGVTPAFLRSLGEAGLITPHRSPGGHRRYSRHQMELATRVRELLDEGLSLASACRLVRVEGELDSARGRIAELEAAARRARGEHA